MKRSKELDAMYVEFKAKRENAGVKENDVEEGILADILSSQKAEVLELALTTFDRELYEQGLREEGEVIGEGKKLLESVENLQKNLHLSLEEALNAIGTTMRDYEKAKELLK